jgi:ABC-type transport system substrate-binding protein
VNRREFLKRAEWGRLGITGFLVGMGRSRGFAHPPSPYTSWDPPSAKSPRRGGILARASAWDPPVLDPRLTNSVGLFQIATLTYNRLLRYPFADEAKNNSDLTLVGDLAEAWEGCSDFRTWTFNLRQGVKWHNVPPLNGRELVADGSLYPDRARRQGQRDADAQPRLF